MPAVRPLKPQKIKHVPTEADVMSWQESFRFVIIAGQATLKSAMLINGGAAVAILAFIGSIWTKGTEQAAADSLTRSIGLFAGGVLAAALATGCTYISQLCYSLNSTQLAGALNVVIVLLVVVSYLLFGWGAYESYSAFARHLPIESVPQ